MRPLTTSETELLSARKAGFPSFHSERLPVLVNFFTDLGVENPALVLNQAEDFVPALDTLLVTEEIAPEDYSWIGARLGYFLGEYFLQRHSGCWFVNDVPDSRYFARYVVGRFFGFGANVMLDPFHAATTFLGTPPPRSLKSLISEIQVELSACT